MAFLSLQVSILGVGFETPIGTKLLLSMGAFLWGDPDQDQWSEITQIIVDQMNR